jgi:anhydro-N-acetylmuramic acid kinase
MIYRAIGLMSGSSLDGLDIAFVEFEENGGHWIYKILKADCYKYSPEWTERLKNAINLNALDYQLLHTAYGHYLGEMVNRFIENNQLHYKMSLIASHGHTTFHVPGQKMTAQLGDGAAIAATTHLPVVSDLRAMDVALGGQGAPIVPIGEKLLLNEYQYFLNIGGIANISFNADSFSAFDICAANRVLNMLANDKGKEYDAGGNMARSGKLIAPLFDELNQLEYYKLPFPKSLANSFGIETVYPIVKKYNKPIDDLLRTYTEHIALQIKDAVRLDNNKKDNARLLITGGGALNSFLTERIQDLLKEENIEVVVPDAHLVNYKEAMIMALIGVLRWREEVNVLRSVTGASKNSIGGALWMDMAE